MADALDVMVPASTHRRSQPRDAEGASLVPLIRDALADDENGWDVSDDGMWCHVTPRGHRWPSQGWKLHVSATLPLAATVLTRVLPVLLGARCAFKFAGTPANVALLNSNHAPRGGSGKFVTVYPDGDEEAVAVAAALHLATAGLNGPLILSDRPYVPGSLVHYRYGSFTDQRVLSNDGIYRDVVYSPSGEPLEDRREAFFAPPEWARCPFPGAGRPATPGGSETRPAAVLLNNRFVVREAIRHANKGGVYRAHDNDGDATVVIKEARPNVAVTPAGTDARDVLRTEAQHLRLLAPLGICPGVIDLFEQGGHLFLAEELIAGTPLRRWVLNRVRHDGIAVHLPTALRVALRLAMLLQSAHSTGLVVRDFNPNNIMVLADEDVRLLDLELAVAADDPGDYAVGGTLAYSAPEQMAGAAPVAAADLFSLGATLCFVLTGADPLLAEDRPVGRSLRERLGCWLSSGDAAAQLPRPVLATIMGLMDDRPERRIPLAEAVQVLRLCAEPEPEPRPALADPGSAGRQQPEPAAVLDGREWDEAVAGLIHRLLTSMNPGNAEQLWPAVAGSDPCNVQHGAAGVVGVLTRYYRLTGDSRVADALAAASAWIERRLAADPFRPPGLYFGRAGIAWALHDAGAAIGDEGLVSRSLELAAALPVQWPNPDLTHGTAGLGLTFLHLWRTTGDRAFLERAGLSADALLTTAAAGPEGRYWMTPPSFDSTFAGERFYGFAHGNAGIGYFLLAHAAAGGGRDSLVGAEAAAEALHDTTISGAGGARWCEGPGHEDVPMTYWCSGSSGVGSFLLRLGCATGDDRARQAAAAAATAVIDHSWAGPLGQCHGAAGNAEFLLDMAGALGEPRYEAGAHHLARVIFARRVYHDGRVLFADSDGEPYAEWADGLSGILAFLLRLRHRGPRLWLADAPSWETSS